MSWVVDKAGDLIEGVGDYVIDPITGEDKRERAKEATDEGRYAAGQARDIAVDYNQRALDAQLASYLEQDKIAGDTTLGMLTALDRGYTGGQAAMADAYGRLDPFTQAGTGAVNQLALAYGEGTPEERAAAMERFKQSADYQFYKQDEAEAQRRQGQMYDRLAPAVSAGQGALSQLSALSGMGTPGEQAAARAAFETSPGCEFRKAEGEKALRRMASAKGNLGSGAMYKDLMRYGQGLASNEYGNYVGQLQSLASQFPTETLARLGLSDVDAARRMGGRSAYGAHMQGTERLASQYPTQALTNMGITEAAAARHQGALIGDVFSRAGQNRSAIEQARGDARSTAYLSEGAAKAGYETASGNLLSQLALTPRGSLSTTVSNLAELTGDVKDVGSDLASFSSLVV